MGVVWRSKEAFQINQFSISAFPPLLFPCLRLSKRGCPRRISQVYLGPYCLWWNMSRRDENKLVWVLWWVTLLHLAVSCSQAEGPHTGLIAQGVAYFLVRDFIHILYSLLTPSPPVIALYTTSHIPATNAFFFRSLPSSRLATVSNRSIRNAGPPPAVPVVCPLLTGGEEALIGCVWLFTLIWSMGSTCCSELLANSGRW